MKVTIDRAKWRTGRYGIGNTDCAAGLARLLNGHGFRCCLGFLGQACGLADASALGIGEPIDVRDDASWPSRLWARCLGFGATKTAEEALIDINDAPDIDDATREAWVAEGFRTVLGVDVEFVGTYPDLERAREGAS